MKMLNGRKKERKKVLTKDSSFALVLRTLLYPWRSVLDFSLSSEQ